MQYELRDRVEGVLPIISVLIPEEEQGIGRSYSKTSFSKFLYKAVSDVRSKEYCGKEERSASEN